MAGDERSTSDLTPGAQMAIFWRILHLLTARYGNHPMGQLLVALTMVFLNERGMPPTLTDLCEATGLPKGKSEWHWQINELEKLFSTVGTLDAKLRVEGDTRDAEEILKLMKEITANSPERIR